MSKKEKLTREQKKEKQRAEYEAMSQKEKDFFDYNKKWHTIGRIWNTIGILLIIAVPIVACIHLKVSPNWAIFADGGIITLIIINLGSGISEPVIYAPMLGTNGEYLAFITGNLSNLKIPCVVKAHEIAETELGTEENELVSTIAVAISSLVTVLIIAVMVLCLAVSPLQQSIERHLTLPPHSVASYTLCSEVLAENISSKTPKWQLSRAQSLSGFPPLSAAFRTARPTSAVCRLW